MDIQNKFNTTLDGTTTINIDDVIYGPTTLIVDPVKTPFLDNILYLNPTKKIFLLKSGTFKLNNILKILKNGICLVGMTGNATDVRIIQTQPKDGILLQANNIILQDLSIQCTFSGCSCLIVASANNTVVSGCNFYGCHDHFSIYYAGPSNIKAGQDTLNSYNNYYLDTGNVFYKNVVYSDYSGDSVSFSLQYKSQFVGNFIRGGKVAVYMCRTTNVYNNTIADSTTNGIFISFPSDNLAIIGNKIYNSTHSAITMRDQVEHGSFPTYSYSIVIQNNILYGARIYGIEMNNAMGISINNNKMASGQTMGIYSYAGSMLSIKFNKLAYFKYGIYLENTNISTIESNTLTSIYPQQGENGIKITNDSRNNTVYSNVMRGSYVYDIIASSNPTTINIQNSTKQYLSIDDERGIYNIM